MLFSLPRTLLILSTALLASCSVVDSDSEWRDIYRDRLRRRLASSGAVEHRMSAPPVDPAPDPDPVAATRVRPEPQDPRRHIDEIEPPVGRRVIGDVQPANPWFARVGGGWGTIGFRAEDTRFHDDSSIWMVRTAVEPAAYRRSGPGIHLETFHSDDDAFRGNLMNDGLQVVRADAQISGFDAFPHLTLRRDLGESLDLTVRAGLFIDFLQVDHLAGDVERTWLGYGGRVEFEPVLNVWRQGSRRFDVAGLLGADFGGVRFHESFVSGDDSDDTTRWMHEAGLDMRYGAPGFSARAGYRYRDIEFGRVETALFGNVGNTESRSHMLFIDAGISF